MEGLLVYNGTDDRDGWFHVFCRTLDIRYHLRMTRLDKPNGPMTDSSKPYFKVGGPKLLIKW